MDIVHLVDRLPRHSSKEWQRRAAPPDCVVIHHSVTPGDYPVERIAEYHVSRGYPGIAYHYVVDVAGRVYRCNDDMALTWHGHDGNSGLGVCLLGDFTRTPPPEAQLSAAVELVAQLRTRWGITRVIGHREAGRAQTACPGDTWPQWAPRLDESGRSIGLKEERVALKLKPLSWFPRPEGDNGWGLHGSTNVQYPLGRPEHIQMLRSELAAMHIRWMKLLVFKDMADAALHMLRDLGIMVTARLFRHQPNGQERWGFDSWLGADEERATGRETFVRLMRLGLVAYWEFSNEDNYNVEWKGQRMPGFRQAVESTTRRYIAEARWALDQGAPMPPLFAAPTPTDGLIEGDGRPPRALQLGYEGEGATAYNDLLWLEEALVILRDEAPDVLEAGFALALHNAGLNRDNTRFPNDEINTAEWTAKGYTPDILEFWFPDGRPTGWSNCWRKYEAYDAIARKVLGGSVPILSTEGGFWERLAGDPRYPVLTPSSQGLVMREAMLGMGAAPDYYFCTGYYSAMNRLAENPSMTDEYTALWRPGYTMPLVEMLKHTSPMLRRAPAEAEPPRREDEVGEAQRQRALKELERVAFMDKVAMAKGLVWKGFEYSEDGQTVTLAQKPGTMEFYRVAVPTGQWDPAKATVERVV